MRRRGFTLVEAITGLLLLSVAGLTLAAAERWFLLSMTRTGRLLLARDRGRRVIAFVEPRVLHAGLGLSGCRDAGSLRRNMGGSGNAPVIASLMGANRFIIVYNDKPVPMTPAVEENGAISGVAFCVLYARASGMFIAAPASAPTLSPGKTAKFSVIAGDWFNSGFLANRSRDLRSWCVLPLTGLPFLIRTRSSDGISLSLSAGVSSPVELSIVNEMLCLCCDRFHVQDGVFRFQGMEENWAPAASYPREDGVLSMWVEWRPGNRTFAIFVLASGGPAVFGSSGRPPEWPESAPWQDGFAGHELYVSRASWRLENI